MFVAMEYLYSTIKFRTFFIYSAFDTCYFSDTTMNGANSLSGVLATVGLTFKHGKREDLLEYGEQALSFKIQILKKFNIVT